MDCGVAIVDGYARARFGKLVHRVHEQSSMSEHADADDLAFDERLPLGLQIKSGIHFTPIGVARRAARMLAPTPGTTVLDVGAGAGKFCLAAAHEVPHAHFTGVELRPHLVRLARALGRELRLPNVTFVDGDAFALDWDAFDAFYFYNPFAEQVSDQDLRLDRNIAHDPETFITALSHVHERLARARIGTRVVTYHGLGGPTPLGYELAGNEAAGTGYLKLWIKTRTVVEHGT